MPLKFPIASPQHRALVLSLYRKILQGTKLFEDGDEAIEEASELFHSHKNEKDPEKIELYLQEAEARYEMALHYKIWRPRQFLFPREGYETAQDVSVMNPHMVPTYLISEYMKEKEESEKYSEHRMKVGIEHRVEFEQDDEHRW